MTLSELQHGKIVTCLKNGQKYMIIGNDAMMKMTDGKWYPCVIYHPLYQNEHDYFVKPRDVFINEFVSAKVN